jgi:hypothetical protein
MNKSILLLDSTNEILEKFQKQGFNIEAGTTGFCDRVRSFPSQLYEKDIFIYDPVLKNDSNDFYPAHTIADGTPEFSIGEITTALVNGGVLLVIVKPLTKDPNLLIPAYSWIPNMPAPQFTKDNIVNIKDADIPFAKTLMPLTTPELRKPVGIKLWYSQMQSAIGQIYLNQKGDALGIYYKIGQGLVILLPEYNSSEELIDVFLHRVLPKLFGSDTNMQLVDDFTSPTAARIAGEITSTEEEIKAQEEKLEKLRQDLATANREKVNKVKADEAAVLILNYYDLALRQEDVALFYLYKVTEALEKKYGGEKEAKTQFNSLNTEWNLIGRLANASYADIRHAPKPGEKTKEWTDDDIERCFEAAKKIINAYLTRLF